MTMTPVDFVAIIRLRVGGEPSPFDSGIQNDRVALEWFLGEVTRIEEGMARYESLIDYLKKEVTTEQEAERMARAYLLYLFGATLYPNRRSKVHLSYLPVLRDLRTASRFDWGGAALGTTYAFLGDSSRTGQSTAGYWRIWEINWNPWGVAGVELEYLASSRAITASRVLLESAFGWQWYLGDRVTRQSLGYTAFQVPGPLPPRASHTSTYTRAELERFTRLDIELTRFLRPEMDYVPYQRDRLARPLGIRAFRDVRSQAHGAAEERRAAGERSRGGEGRVRVHASMPMRGGPPEMSWRIPVVDAQGNQVEIHLVPARVEPPSVTVPVPNEWVNEAIRRMLAFENVVRRAGQATSRSKRTRSPPQKKIAARTPTPPVTSRRQTRSSQPVAASKEATKQAVARAEE
ncbi:hypothetical protein RHMOL_Rhmol02G0173600 [Rhododendron molle]|uniref:Uncharacterized protein n=1 Tax=Rhododendron molle TaxID=49168 RepID=A0ACC0PQW9_RHOML|nr:hypothetical protein RHMOL_Rhmol02G0173600 [Rhododendron molle]